MVACSFGLALVFSHIISTTRSRGKPENDERVPCHTEGHVVFDLITSSLKGYPFFGIGSASVAVRRKEVGTGMMQDSFLTTISHTVKHNPLGRGRRRHARTKKDSRVCSRKFSDKFVAHQASLL